MLYYYSNKEGNMKKSLVILMSVMAVFLTACGGSGKEGEKASKNSPEDFAKLTEVYFEKQQALMMKQAEGQSGEFADLSQHAQDLIESDEYKDWEKEVKNVEAFKMEKNEKNEKYMELQESLNKYSKIQTEYFQELAKAQDVDEYNGVNTKLAAQLGEAQDAFINIMNTIEE